MGKATKRNRHQNINREKRRNTRKSQIYGGLLDNEYSSKMNDIIGKLNLLFKELLSIKYTDLHNDKVGSAGDQKNAYWQNRTIIKTISENISSINKSIEEQCSFILKNFNLESPHSNDIVKRISAINNTFEPQIKLMVQTDGYIIYDNDVNESRDFYTYPDLYYSIVILRGCLSDMNRLLDSYDKEAGDEKYSPIEEDNVSTVGIISTGASCYYNAVLQLIYRTPEIRETIDNATNETYMDDTDKQWLMGIREFFKSMDESTVKGTACNFITDKSEGYFDNLPEFSLKSQGDSKDLLGKIITATAHGSINDANIATFKNAVELVKNSSEPNTIHFELGTGNNFYTITPKQVDAPIPPLMNDTYTKNLELMYTNDAGTYMKPYADIHVFDKEKCLKSDKILLSEKLVPVPGNIPSILIVNVNRQMDTQVDTELVETINTLASQLPSVGKSENEIKNPKLFNLIAKHLNLSGQDEYEKLINHFIKSLSLVTSNHWNKYTLPDERNEVYDAYGELIKHDKINAQHFIIFKDEDTMDKTELEKRAKLLEKGENIDDIINRLIIPKDKLKKFSEYTRLTHKRQKNPLNKPRKCMTKVDFSYNQTLEISGATYDLFAICMNRKAREASEGSYNSVVLHPYADTDTKTNNWITYTDVGGHWTLLMKDNENVWRYYDDSTVSKVDDIKKKYDELHLPKYNEFTANIMVYRLKPKPVVEPVPAGWHPAKNVKFKYETDEKTIIINDDTEYTVGECIQFEKPNSGTILAKIVRFFPPLDESMPIWSIQYTPWNEHPEQILPGLRINLTHDRDTYSGGDIDVDWNTIKKVECSDDKSSIPPPAETVDESPKTVEVPNGETVKVDPIKVDAPPKKTVKTPSKSFTCKKGAREFTYDGHKITFEKFAEKYGIQLIPPKNDLT
jgi:hypothetical protein